MTPKTNNNDSMSDGQLRDIEGHPIEKITTSKLSEKALLEKWRQEEEELEKVRKARDILRQLKENGMLEKDLIEKAKELSKQIMKPTEIYGLN